MTNEATKITTHVYIKIEAILLCLSVFPGLKPMPQKATKPTPEKEPGTETVAAEAAP